MDHLKATTRKQLAWAPDALCTDPVRQLLREQVERFFTKDAPEDGEAMSQRLLLLRDALDQALNDLVDEALTPTHERAAKDLLARWVGGETTFALPGSRTLELPALTKKDAKEVTRLAGVLQVHKLRHFRMEYRYGPILGTECELTVGKLRATFRWVLERMGATSEHYEQIECSFPWPQNDPRALDEYLGAEVPTTLRGQPLQAFFHVVAFDLLDQFALGYPRPEGDKIYCDE